MIYLLLNLLSSNLVLLIDVEDLLLYQLLLLKSNELFLVLFHCLVEFSIGSNYHEWVGALALSLEVALHIEEVVNEFLSELLDLLFLSWFEFVLVLNVVGFIEDLLHEFLCQCYEGATWSK